MATTLTLADPIVTSGTGAQATDWLTLTSAQAGTGRPIKIYKVIWSNPGASGSFSISDGAATPSVLLADSTPAAYVDQSVKYEFASDAPMWKNFKITALTAGTLYIYYR